jgi:hypothetical protein
MWGWKSVAAARASFLEPGQGPLVEGAGQREDLHGHTAAELADQAEVAEVGGLLDVGSWLFAGRSCGIGPERIYGGVAASIRCRLDEAVRIVFGDFTHGGVHDTCSVKSRGPAPSFSGILEQEELEKAEGAALLRGCERMGTGTLIFPGFSRLSHRNREPVPILSHVLSGSGLLRGGRDEAGCGRI